MPEWLGELFQQLLAKDPAKRPASATEVAERLGGREEKRWNTAVVVAGAVAVVVLLFLIVLVLLQQFA